MTANYLPIAVKNSGVALETILPRLASAAPDQKIYLHVCLLFRRLAIGNLLMSSDPEPFAAYLFKSSRAYGHFADVVQDLEKTTSRGGPPFFDAVACLDEEGARAIARLSPYAHNPRREYEEDFLYTRFLMDLYQHGPGRPGLQDLLAKWEGLAADGSDLRLPICKALLARDDLAFQAVLRDAVAERVQKLQKEEEAERLNPDEAAIAPYVSTEVLAWVELGRRLGLAAPADLPLAPAVARLTAPPPFPDPESWRVPETYRSLQPPRS